MVTSYFGIASHTINGVTLNLLKLPIRGKNCCELKDMQARYADTEARMAYICYLIID